MIDRSKIVFQHWSLKVGRADPVTLEVRPFFGEIVSAVDDLDQCISNLILTPKGSVPTEPEKGINYDGVIDKHPDIGVPLLTQEIWDALAMWEPRIVVKDIKVTQSAFAHFVAQIFWRPIESVLDDLRLTEITYQGAV